MDLQRASAGSGKTFQLAKTYIRDLITRLVTVDPSQARQDEKTVNGVVKHYYLRTPAELTGSQSHILAITFTNKATNEMKDRIVKKLADLARGYCVDSKGRRLAKTPDYQADFLREFYGPKGEPVTAEMLQTTCRAGLRELLNGYSDFNISTIDSFFQLVLRTFAYELRLNDNFRLELDDDFLHTMGVNETLSSVNRKDTSSRGAAKWVSKFVSERMADNLKWDVMEGASDNDSDSNFSGTPYSELLGIVKSASAESFKQKLRELLDYFADKDRNGTGMSGSQCFDEYYRAVNVHYRTGIRRLANECRVAAGKVQSNIRALYPDAEPEKVLARGLWTVIQSYLDATGDEPPKKLTSATAGNLESGVFLGDKEVASKSKASDLEQRYPAVREDLSHAGEAARRWRRLAALREAAVGRLYYVQVLSLVMDSIAGFRRDNNLLPLSETNTILRDIIGDDDVPFIFERLGTLLQHFLIDEFQDTSLMQWENLVPLLRNAEGDGNDNLIIGDAKQSIYRFRNAEPDLITSGVDKEFSTTMDRTRPTPNTNWRSAREIVEFNNRLFEDLTAQLDAGLAGQPGRRSMKPVYHDIKQNIAKKDLRGCVRISFRKENEFTASLGEMIAGLLAQGWRQRDIAVLCNVNRSCHDVIESLLAYNSDHKDDAGFVPFEIMSDEALMVKDSVAVKIILAVLTVIAGSTDAKGEQPDDEGKLRKQPLSPEELEFMYHVLRRGRGDIDITKVDRRELEHAVPAPEIESMLRAMPVVSLPALVDAAVSRFVPEDLRQKDAAYISAFMDAVLDYCDSYTADAPSFLKWWGSNKKKVTVASPKENDAVTVMTIHKSKGLEFPVVIVPGLWNIDIGHRDKTLIWVKPNPADVKDPRIMPPYIPLSVTDHDVLAGSYYAREYLEEYDRSRIDQLNKAYVAFTRPERMLFINAGALSADKKKGKYSSPDKGDFPDLLLPLLKGYSDAGFGTLSLGAGEECFTYGEPEALVAPTAEKKADASSDGEKDGDDNAGNVQVLIKDYYVNAPMPKLRVLTGSGDKSGAPSSTAKSKGGDAGEERPAFLFGAKSPRERGILIHDIMRMIRTREDKEKILRRFRIDGRISAAESERLSRRIGEAMDLDEALPWFAQGVKVISERDIFCGNGDSYRPDRMTDDGETLTVIDYKTGSPESARRYREQLRNYMALMCHHLEHTGERRHVEGWLLYIPDDETLQPVALRID